MTTQTAGDIIKLALKLCGATGVGQTPLAEDSNDALTILNSMLGQWNSRRWLVHHLIDLTWLATGALSYSIGPSPGGSFDTGFNPGFNTAAQVDCASRPDRIEAAYASLNYGTIQQIDYPLIDLQAKEAYDNISMKQLPSFPQFFFWDSAYPIGNLFVWPVPTNLYQITISIMDRLLTLNKLDDPCILPPQYQEAVLYNLAARLYPLYGDKMPDPTVVALAKSSLATIRTNNAQVPRLKMPAGLKGSGGHYNILGDYSY